MTRPIVVIGGGPAGVMAAVRASQVLPSSVELLERNDKLCVKLGLTGRGRCNLTNTAPIEDFCGRFGKNGVFLRNVFSRFFTPDLTAFFEDNGLKLKTERQGRMFPESDTSASVISVLFSSLKKSSVKTRTGCRVKNIKPEGGSKKILFEDGSSMQALKVVVATGGVSYPQTGSTGDGFIIARGLGHKVSPLSGGLVPLETKEAFIKGLQGLTLKNIRIKFSGAGHKMETETGELLFTHFGVSGPLVLDNSAVISDWLKQGQVKASVDLKCGLSEEELDRKFCSEFPKAGSAKVLNYLQEVLPKRLVDAVLGQAQVEADKKCHQLTSAERKALIHALKNFAFTITKPRPLAEAMVTCGGVSLKEIDPKTMGSRIVPGVYFCGEVLDLAASSGGFNLQAAFSTGWAAGEAAALSILEGNK